MPIKLPDETSLGARPTPGVSTGIARYTPSAAGTDAIGTAKVTAGRRIAGSGKMLAAAFELEYERQDRIAAENAINKTKAAQLELTLGEHGFTKIRGEQAVNGDMLESFPEQLKDQAKGYRDGLKNSRQKQLYTRAAESIAIQFKEDLLRHSVRERETFAANVYKAGVELEVKSATARWQDPGAIQLSLTRLDEIIKTEGERRGWDATMVKAEQAGAASAVHAAVIGQAIASDQTEYAAAWYEKNKKAIDPRTATLVQRSVEQATQKQIYNGYRAEMRAAKNNNGSLAALEKRVTADTKIDETRKESLLTSLEGRQEINRRKAEAAYERQVRVLQRGIGNATNHILKGWQIDDATMGQMITQAHGTELEGEVKALVNLQAQTSSFRLAPPPVQAKATLQLEAAIRKNKGGPRATQILGAFQAIQESQGREIQANPTGFAQRQGLADPDQLDPSKPWEDREALKRRVELARAMNQGPYGAPFKPYQPHEVAAITKGLNDGGAKEKRTWFGQIAQALGDDKPAYMGIMAQIAPDDPATAIAGQHAGNERPGVAELIIAGQDILHPPAKKDGTPSGGKLWPMPPDNELRVQFESNERNVFAGHPKSRNAAYQAVNAAYAKMISDKGNSSGILDGRLYNDAMALVLGGIQNYNAKSVVLPYGMDIGAFETGVQKRILYFHNQGLLDPSVTADRLAGKPLEQIGDGRYHIITGPDTLAADKNGRPIVIDFNNPAPFVTSGTEARAAPRTKRADPFGASTALGVDFAK